MVNRYAGDNAISGMNCKSLWWSSAAEVAGCADSMLLCKIPNHVTPDQVRDDDKSGFKTFKRV